MNNIYCMAIATANIQPGQKSHLLANVYFLHKLATAINFIIKTESAQTTQNNAVCIFLRTFIRGNKWTIVANRETNDTDKI